VISTSGSHAVLPAEPQATSCHVFVTLSPLRLASSRRLKQGKETSLSRPRPSSFLTMPKEKSKKYLERISLARNITLRGIEMSPCSFCERNGHQCLVAEESSRCGECARRGQKCDVEGIPTSSWLALEREEERLSSEEAKATATAAEAMARLSRLQKQKKFLRSRAKDMLRRGLKTLDELDAAEEKERLEKEEMERYAAIAAGQPESSADFFQSFDPSDPAWGGLGFADETPQASQGS